MAIELRGVTPLYDMPTSVRFYRGRLGFAVVTTSPPLCGGRTIFTGVSSVWGEAELMLNTAYESDDERPVPPDPARTVSHNDTCRYLGCPDIDAAYVELQAKGVPSYRQRLLPTE